MGAGESYTFTEKLDFLSGIVVTGSIVARLLGIDNDAENMTALGFKPWSDGKVAPGLFWKRDR